MLVVEEKKYSIKLDTVPKNSCIDGFYPTKSFPQLDGN